MYAAFQELQESIVAGISIAIFFCFWAGRHQVGTHLPGRVLQNAQEHLNRVRCQINSSNIETQHVTRQRKSPRESPFSPLCSHVCLGSISGTVLNLSSKSSLIVHSSV